MRVDRRNFIKTSGMFAAGSMLLPPFMQSCQNVQISAEVKSYLDHFEISTEMLQKVIAAAMSVITSYSIHYTKLYESGPGARLRLS